MRISAIGLEMIKEFEGVRLGRYKDVAGLWTIGVGHLITKDDNLPDIITEKHALELLDADLDKFERAVNKVDYCMTQPQFDAMVSLAFNIGVGAFNKSSVKRRLEKGDIEGSAEAFTMWKKAGGRVVPGLLMRRIVEAIIFNDGKVTEPMLTDIEQLSERHIDRMENIFEKLKYFLTFN